MREELAGSLWAIHGGGFYHVEKYKVAPKTLPEKLHWFMWEAYLTWLTGVFMLIVVYYANARVVMIDPAVRTLSPTLAIALGAGSMAVAWLVYDLLCRTPLVERRGRFALLGFGLVVPASIALSELLSGRAAYMHVGAMLGTLMAGNVFFVIIPSQRALVRAAERGEAPDPRLGQQAGLRSLHNNYLTLPVVFVMISSHFPFTYGHPANWAILAGLFLASVGVRHYLNLRERGRDAIWLLPLATVMVLVLAYVTAPPSAAARSQGDGEPVAFSQVETIADGALCRLSRRRTDRRAVLEPARRSDARQPRTNRGGDRAHLSERGTDRVYAAWEQDRDHPRRAGAVGALVRARGPALGGAWAS